ncbi:hypothetical protein NM688_g1280 [Phlebia brevispora]|uniref:Uncharacterized protein n=1 Tax=Phlebia brevispora TaxID=194682 RepID=A0ACC1TBX7_9APHY|nr:hypothetical protein NM688_g1280 [Phlebia brevispora]
MFSPTSLFPYSPPLSPPQPILHPLPQPPPPSASSSTVTTLSIFHLPITLPITSSITSNISSSSSRSLAWSATTSSSFSKLSLKSSSSSIATMTTVLSTGPHTDMFEHIFRRLEEESAQRAREEEERERLEAEAEGRPTAQEVADEVIPNTNTSTIRASRERRRTSVSISRFGQPVDGPSSDSQPSSTRPSRSSSIVLTRPAFYQLDARYQPETGSADSLASSAIAAVTPVDLQSDLPPTVARA